ncbi:STAS domain-containing protein [Amycolatopsis sp. NPDC051102]|uniref:STAS domain-containing protein n=1 Tax=Amycolatopsis sp. NPDC051102 TaxID=3155163 RepID=UPI00343CC46C
MLGELDFTVTGDLVALLGREVGLRPRALVVDASAVRFCAARGVTVLVEAVADAEIAGVPFAVVGRQQTLLRPITVLGLEQVLPLHHSAAEAVAWLGLLPQLIDLHAGLSPLPGHPVTPHRSCSRRDPDGSVLIGRSRTGYGQADGRKRA